MTFTVAASQQTGADATGAVLVEVEHFGDGGDASVTAGDSLRMEETFQEVHNDS